ncbi:hypothetical protein ACFC4G_38025 [Streptomyces sp. NPDC056002]|uniref:hypothetical protein n=1 Tax=Streptomyces sp. NPDC056002 TaxID=3345675 RepID=UPI0035D9F1D2
MHHSTLNLDVFDFELPDDENEMASIATLDIGATLCFDHHDPEIVNRLGTRRLDG